MSEGDAQERDAVRAVFHHIVEASWLLQRLASGDSPTSEQDDRDTAAVHLESFIAGLDDLRAVPFPPEIAAAAHAALAALRAGQYGSAKHHGGRAGSLMEVFLARHYPSGTCRR